MSAGETEPLIKVNGGNDNKDTPSRGCWTRFRESSKLVVAVVFVAMMLDLMVVTSIDPLLPAILRRMDLDVKNRGGNFQPEVPIDNYAEMNGSRLLEDKTLNTTPPVCNDLAEMKDRSVEQRVGILVAVKPATEVVVNIIVGAMVAKFGHIVPMMIGFIFNTASTLGFAYAPTFLFLVLARVSQAVASSLSIIAGLAMISSSFRDETERSKAISTAFSGLSVGIVLGYPFGSVTYQFVGRQAPFIGLAVLSAFDGVLRMMIKTKSQDTENSVKEKPTAYLRLIKDPYILSALACNFAPNFALGVFLATGPAWMLETLNAEQWQVGSVMATAVLFQITTQYISGRFGTRHRWWKFCLIGLWLHSVGLIIYPYCRTVWMVTVPEILTRSGFGMVICVISPALCYYVDTRHESNYGEVFGLYTASYNVALTVGPLSGGFLLNYLSFASLYISVSAFIFVTSFLSFVLMDPKCSVP